MPSTKRWSFLLICKCEESPIEEHFGDIQNWLMRYLLATKVLFQAGEAACTGRGRCLTLPKHYFIPVFTGPSPFEAVPVTDRSWPFPSGLFKCALSLSTAYLNLGVSKSKWRNRGENCFSVTNLGARTVELRSFKGYFSSEPSL